MLENDEMRVLQAIMNESSIKKSSISLVHHSQSLRVNKTSNLDDLLLEGTAWQGLLMTSNLRAAQVTVR